MKHFTTSGSLSARNLSGKPDQMLEGEVEEGMVDRWAVIILKINQKRSIAEDPLTTNINVSSLKRENIYLNIHEVK